MIYIIAFLSKFSNHHSIFNINNHIDLWNPLKAKNIIKIKIKSNININYLFTNNNYNNIHHYEKNI